MTEEKPVEKVAKKDKSLKKIAKKSLKTMRKTRKRHVVREQARIVKYGTKGFGRNIWLSSAATIVMAMTLIILFVTIVASVILTNTAEMMKIGLVNPILSIPDVEIKDSSSFGTSKISGLFFIM